MTILAITVDGRHDTLDFVRTRMVAVVEEEAAEWNEEHEDDQVDVGWTWED